MALVDLDRAAFDRSIRARPRPLEPIIAAGASVGRGAAAWLAIGLALRATGRPLPVIRFAATTCGAYAGSLTVARLLGRRRPFELRDVRVLVPRPVGPSFPSDQVAAAFAALPFLCDAAPAARPALIGTAGMLAVCRVLAGVHYPGDVLAAAALGSAVGFTVLRARR